LPAVQVPIGTYTGWNLRPRGLAEDELAGLLGSFIPFAKTKSQRRKKSDLRPSLQERYKGRDDYARQFSRAARNLVEQRYLLTEDAERMISEIKKRRIP
jgi:alpha/beta hydrolase family protein